MFESSADSDYSMDDIKKLPGFMLLLAIGYYESSTSVMKNHMTMRLYNSELSMEKPNDNVTVYSTGYVRRLSKRGGPWGDTEPSIFVLKKFSPLNGMLTWNDQFLYIYEWTIKQFKKKGITKFNDIDTGQFINMKSIIDYMAKKNEIDKALVYKLYELLDAKGRNTFTKKIGVNRKDFEERKKKYDLGLNIVSKWLT